MFKGELQDKINVEVMDANFKKLVSNYTYTYNFNEESHEIQTIKFKFHLVFNELKDFEQFYLLLNPKTKSEPELDFVSDYNSFSRSFVKDINIEQNIKPSYFKLFNHYKKFKYVLNRLSKNNSIRCDDILYDHPILPIIDKIGLIDNTSVRPIRFPCNFEKIYNEKDFSKYLLVHHHKIKNRHNLETINKQNGYYNPLKNGLSLINAAKAEIGATRKLAPRYISEKAESCASIK